MSPRPGLSQPACQPCSPRLQSDWSSWSCGDFSLSCCVRSGQASACRVPSKSAHAVASGTCDRRPAATPVLSFWPKGVANDSGLRRQRLRLWRLPFVHGRRHPLASQVEKLLLKLRVLGQAGEPHALARVADAIIVWGRGHKALPVARVAGGSANGLSATGAWIRTAASDDARLLQSAGVVCRKANSPA